MSEVINTSLLLSGFFGLIVLGLVLHFVFWKSKKYQVKSYNGSNYVFSAKTLLENYNRDLSYNFMDTINAFRKLCELKYSKRNNLEICTMRALSHFTDEAKLYSLIVIFDIYKAVDKSSERESFLVDFCKVKLERFNSSFSVAKTYSDSFFYPYDEVKKFFDQVGCDCDDSGFDHFLETLNPELHKKVQYMQEWMKEDSVAPRYDNLLEKVLSFEKVKDVPGNAKTFLEKLVLDCGRSFAEQVQEDAQNKISQKLVFVLISQKFGFLDGLSNFEGIKKITGKYIRPEHVSGLHDLDKQKISLFL